MSRCVQRARGRSREPASSLAIVTVSITLPVMAQSMSDNNEKPLDPRRPRIVARRRRLMMIASMTTFVAVAVTLGSSAITFSGWREGRSRWI